MAYQDIDSIFTALQIRNTSLQTSSIAISGEYIAKTILLDNGHNQIVTLQLQGSDNQTDWFDVGAAIDIPATTKTYETLTDFFPYYRATAQCSVAPASGDLDVRIIKAHNT